MASGFFESSPVLIQSALPDSLLYTVQRLAGGCYGTFTADPVLYTGGNRVEFWKKGGGC